MTRTYRYIHEIKRESKRCKKIVQDLLSYARTPKPDLEETDLNELLEPDQSILPPITPTCTMSPSPGSLPPTCRRILVDGDQLRQVAINLILNAGAAMHRGRYPDRPHRPRRERAVII